MKVFFEKHAVRMSLRVTETTTYAPHFHADVEIVVLLEGRMDCMIDGETYALSEGDVVAVFPNQVHSYQDRTPLQAAVLIFDATMVPEFEAVFQDAIPRYPVIKKERLQMAGVYTALECAVGDFSTSGAQVRKGWLLVLLGKLLNGYELVKKRRAGMEITVEILSYCQSHYHEGISLKSTAKALHISESRLSHIFSERLKMGFCSYINMLRINEAANLLLQTELSVTEIAGRCGFSATRSFNRAFLKQIGTTPAKYRRAGTRTEG